MKMADEKMNELVAKYHNDLSERIRAYLNRRCIPNQTIDKFKIGWSGSSIIIPIYDKRGEYIFFKYRKDPDEVSNKPKSWYDKGAEASLYGWENLTSHKPFIVICEGEFDRLVLESNGIPAITSTGGVGSFKDEWIPYFKDVSSLYVCFDSDGAGLTYTQKLLEKLPHARLLNFRPYGHGRPCF